MKTILFLAFLTLSTALFGESLFSHSVPIFLWSGQRFFKENSNQYLESLKETQQDHLFKKILGLGYESETLNGKLEDTITHPEVAVVFVLPKLSVQHVSHLSSAYHHKPGQDSSLNSLQKCYKGSKSSLLIPYTQISNDNPLSSSVESAALELRKQFPSSTVLTVTNPEELMEIISQKDHQIFTNNIPDLFIVNLQTDVESNDAQDQIKAEDLLIGRVQEQLSANSNGNYVAALSGNVAPHSHVKRSFLSDSTEHQEISSSQQTYSNYAPPVFVEVFLVCFILLLITLVAVCCTLDLQTPAAFEAPKWARRPEHHA